MIGDLFAKPTAAVAAAAKSKSSTKPRAKDFAELSAKPFTFANDKASVQGKFGTLAPGSTSTLNALEILHLRFGHLSARALLHMLKHNAIIGAGTTYEACKNLTIRFCIACQRGAMRRAHVPPSLKDYSQMAPFSVIGLDPVPMSTVTYHGNKYVNFGVDYSTRFVFTYESPTNGNQREILMNIQRDYCLTFGWTIHKLVTDSHSVFLGKQTVDFLVKEKILQQATPPYEHQRNLVESASVRPLLDMARKLLVQAGMSPRMAGIALVHAARTMNMIPKPRGATVTPYERVTGEKPDVSGMRAFGCRVEYHNAKEVRGLTNDPRWSEKASHGVIVGLSSVVKGAYLILTRSLKIITRRQVVVYEGPPEGVLNVYDKAVKPSDFLSDNPDLETPEPVPDDGTAAVPADALALEPDPQPQPAVPARYATRGALQRNTAISNFCAMFCECCDTSGPESAISMAMAAIALPPVPRSIQACEARAQAPEWAAAIWKEILTMLDPEHPKYSMWFGADPTTWMNAVLAFRVTHETEILLKYKARLCPDGSKLLQGIDFDQSFSPTARRPLIFMMLHVIATMDYEAKQFDVTAAYLEVPAEGNQFMRMSDDMMRVGFSTTRFVRLLVNFYGRPDAGRNWYVYFMHIMLEFGLDQSAEEPCLFTLVRGEGEGEQRLFVLLFVDDGLYASNNADLLREFEAFLESKIRKITYKPLTKFVGMSIRRDRVERKVFVSIPDFTADLLHKFPLIGTVTSADTPIPTTLQYRDLHGTEKPVWEQAGSAMFAADTVYPDLRLPAALLATGGANPHVNHVKAAQRVMHYISAHQERELELGGVEPIELIAASDASYEPAGDSRYQYGYALSLNRHSGFYSIASKRSKTVSHSSLQSEMRALCDVCKEVSADRDLLAALGFPQQKPTLVLTDSLCAIDLVNNRYGFHPKCRHFNRDTNYVRECVNAGIVELGKIHTDDNPTDLLTKLMSGDGVSRHVQVLLKGFAKTV